MATNLIDQLKGQLTSAVAGQISKSLGIPEKTVSTGVEALIPVILGKAIEQTSTKSRADDFARTLDRDELKNGGFFDNLRSILGDATKQDELSSLGGSLVKSLFGDKLGAFLPMLGKLLGIDSGKSTSLLGLIVPIVLSLLSKQKTSQNLDASSFASLLGSQKEFVAKALPTGFSDVLGLANILPSAKGPSRSSQAEGSGIAKLLIPLLLLGALVFFVYKYLGQGADGVKEKAGEIAENLDLEVPTISLPKFDLPDLSALKLPEEASELTGIFNEFNAAFTGVEDEESAKLAIPKFEDLNTQFDGFSSKIGGLPEVVQSAVKTQVAELLGPIQKLIDQVYAIPGVKAILEPIIDQTISKIKSIAGA